MNMVYHKWRTARFLLSLFALCAFLLASCSNAFVFMNEGGVVTSGTGSISSAVKALGLPSNPSATFTHTEKGNSGGVSFTEVSTLYIYANNVCGYFLQETYEGTTVITGYSGTYTGTYSCTFTKIYEDGSVSDANETKTFTVSGSEITSGYGV